VVDALSAKWNATSLRTKMTGVSVLLLALGLLVAGFGSMSVLKTYLTSDTDKKINAVVTNFRSVVNFSVVDGELTCQVVQVPDYYIAVLYTGDEPLCDNMSAADGHPDTSSLENLDFTSNDTDAFTVANTPGPGQWRVVGLPLVTAANDTVSIVVGQDTSTTDGLISRYAAVFLFFALTVVILGAALTRLLVTSTFTPLREVEATAARFAAGDFAQRLGGATQNTEVGRLNRSLNAMLSQIDRAFADRAKTIDQMRRFVGDASHELRTPLVSVRGYAELYRMGALQKPEDVAQAMERIEKEAIRMGELVTDLLELARIDEAKPLQLTEVDLIPLAGDAALDAMASSPGRTVSVTVNEITPRPETVEPDAPLVTPSDAATRTSPLATGPISFAGATLARLRGTRGRPRVEKPVDTESVAVVAPAENKRIVVLAEENKIRQVITNLMGNAMRFTPADSPIEIAVEADRVLGLAAISLVDHGEGIPPQIREKIFQRFWRADSSRNRDTGGSGLGLAIVASIVAAHHGEVQVVDTPGGGATFRVILPLLQETSDALVLPEFTE
jgi:two-component system OmpR family sensor kinase